MRVISKKKKKKKEKNAVKLYKIRVTPIQCGLVEISAYIIELLAETLCQHTNGPYKNLSDGNYKQVARINFLLSHQKNNQNQYCKMIRRYLLLVA